MTLHYATGVKDDRDNFSSIRAFVADVETQELCPKCVALDALLLDTPDNWNVIDEEAAAN